MFKLNINSYEILSYPFLQWFNLSDLYSQFYNNTILVPPTIAIVYHLLTFIGILIIGYVLWKTPFNPLKLIFLGFYLMYMVVFLYFYNSGAEISLEARHLKILAYLFLPLLCTYVAQFHKISTPFAILLIAINTGYGLLTFSVKKWQVYKHYTVGKSGYSLKHVSASDLAFIHAKDDPNHPERIWFFVPTSINIEVQHGRKLLSGFNFKASQIGKFVNDVYYSKSEKIYCVLHRLYDKSHDHPSLEAMFPSYDFKLVKTGTEIVIYEGSPVE